MNCPNCECDRCVQDRKNLEPKKRRLRIMKSWEWNDTTYQAARRVKREIEAGKAGDFEDWRRSIEEHFDTTQAQDILQNLKQLI